MGIKRKIEDNLEQPEKKTKLDETFPMETFVKNLKDPESCFLGEFDSAEGVSVKRREHVVVALSEFNEYVRRLSPQEKLDAFLDDLLQRIQSNLDDVLALITEEKRKSSEVKSCPESARKRVSFVEYDIVPFSNDTAGILLSEECVRSV